MRIRMWARKLVDAGDEDQPEHFVDREHAPLWLMPEVIAFKRHAGCREVTFPPVSYTHLTLPTTWLV